MKQKNAGDINRSLTKMQRRALGECLGESQAPVGNADAAGPQGMWCYASEYRRGKRC